VNRFACFATMAVVCLLAFGCSDTSTNPPAGQVTTESQEAAMCLSGELYPPAALSAQIASNLSGIRSMLGDQYPALEKIEFTPPWIGGRVLVSFHSDWVQLVRDRTYADWDHLNLKFGVSEVDTTLLRFGTVVLKSDQLLNPLRMVDAYIQLPGVASVEPSGRIGDGSNIYIRDSGDSLTYLFREAWGDCPAGCIYSKFLYISLSGGIATLVGTWDPEETEEPPPWWEEAQLNMEMYGCL